MWLLLACQPAPPAQTPDLTTDARPADTAVPEVIVEIPQAALSAAEVASAIEAALASGMPSPVLPRRTYLEMFSGRDEDCPGGAGYNLPGAFQGCVSEGGWLYAGVAEYDGSIEPDQLGDFSLLADCYMVDPDGRWFIAAGELLLLLDGDESGGSMVGELSGTWSYGPAGQWMAPDGAGAVLSMEAQWAGEGWDLSLEGTVTDGTRAVRLWSLSASSGECGGVPVGVYGLRGDGGYWYEIDATDCGCGAVTYADGSELGEACVDLSAAASGLVAGMRQ